MSRPNINPDTGDHKYCHEAGWWFGAERARLGDVRKCTHGKVQVYIEPDRGGGLIGPGTYYWYDLHPVWDFKRYRKAKALLEQKGN